MVKENIFINMPREPAPEIKDTPRAETSYDSFDQNPSKKLLIFVFVLSTLMPNYFHAGSIRLSPYLIVIIIAFFPIFFIWAACKLGKISLPDILILLSCVYATVSLAVNHDISTTVEASGVFFLQTFGAYLLGKYCVRDANSMGFLCIILALAAIFVLPFAAIEALTGEKPYLRLFSILGPVHADVVRPPRLGFERVQGPFEHPILFGVFIASLFSLVYFNLKSGLIRTLALLSIILSTFLSLSVGAYVTLIVQIILIAWSGIFSKNNKRWRNLFLIFIFLYIAVDLASNRTPFNVFVDYMTLNSGNAYNRILIWKFGSAEILRYPFFGIGLNEWTRPFYMSASMDNFWLLMAVRHGIPVFAFLFCAIFLILWRSGRRQLLPGKLLRIRRGVIMSIIAIMIAICSVHLWNATYAWLMFIAGATTWLMDAGRPAGAAAAEEAIAPADENENTIIGQRSLSAPPSQQPRAILGARPSVRRGKAARDVDQL